MPQSSDFYTLGPLPEVGKLALLDAFLTQGLPAEASHAAIWKNDWTTLPIDAQSMKELTCNGCGKKPFRSPQGRIILGCAGACLQKEFVDMKEQSLASRMAESQRQANRVVNDNPLLAFMGRVEERWQPE
ncbi:MAG: hypothetical protein ACK5VI_10710 [Opitutia bacterium]|jgi:hypothetical protein